MQHKNKMEGKKLNLNRPPLSVRRRSMTLQKDHKNKTVNSVPIATWPSPCPVVKNPGAVPFLWEQVPGQPKEDLIPHSHYCSKPPIAPKNNSRKYANADQTDSHRTTLTNNDRDETVNVPRNTNKYSYSHERVRNVKRMKETTKELESSSSEDSDDSAPKSKPVGREGKKVKKRDNHLTSLRYGLRFVNMFSHRFNGEEEKSDDGSDRSGNVHGLCWVLPPFCSKSAVGVLNHVPNISMSGRVLMSRISNLKPRSSSSGSCKSSDNESKSNFSHQQTIDKILAAEFEEKTRLSNESGQSHITASYGDAWSISFGSHGKQYKTFGEELNLDDVSEKTLYVDTVRKVESPKSTAYSPVIQDSKVVYDSSDEDCEIITKRMDQMHLKDSSTEDCMVIDTVDKEGKTVPNAQEIDDFDIQSSIGKLKMKRQKFWDFPVPPPLPKSPTDSWLGRTLPSVSSKNRSYSPRILQNQFSKGNKRNIQREADVDSTNVQCQHLRYSEENLKPILET